MGFEKIKGWAIYLIVCFSVLTCYLIIKKGEDIKNDFDKHLEEKKEKEAQQNNLKVNTSPPISSKGYLPFYEDSGGGEGRTRVLLNNTGGRIFISGSKIILTDKDRREFQVVIPDDIQPIEIGGEVYGVLKLRRKAE